MNIILSSIGGLIASLVYFIASYFFDKELSANESNLISSSISVLLDIILQSIFFKKTYLLKNKNFLIKALTFEALTVYLNQILFNTLLKYVEKKNIKLKIFYVRIIVSIILFVIYTYPVRKYMLFK